MVLLLSMSSGLICLQTCFGVQPADIALFCNRSLVPSTGAALYKTRCGLLTRTCSHGKFSCSVATQLQGIQWGAGLVEGQ
jgi:hypothetical protein